MTDPASEAETVAWWEELTGRGGEGALRELALSIEALERFGRREPLRRVHECVFGVLALESQAVDPRRGETVGESSGPDQDRVRVHQQSQRRPRQYMGRRLA